MLRSLTGGLHLDDIPTPVKRMAVSETAPAAQVLSRLRAGRYYELLVLDGAGRLTGLVSSPQLYEAVLRGADTMKNAALPDGSGEILPKG
jgi:CBS-domain-containing membrane protein